MILHSMNIIKKAVHFLNPDQILVVMFDQPLYVIAKNIQWYWQDTPKEDHFVVMLGGLHTEMAALKVIGTWLEGSGWRSAITQANIATSGKADSLLKVSHVTRTRHAHQITFAALHILMRLAYEDYMLSNSNTKISFEAWKTAKRQKSPHFQYWETGKSP